jgi:hypothetical protein
MRHIQKRGDRRYRARRLDPDGRERYRTFTPKADEILFLTPSPFAGCGPTLMVALGHGRDSIGIAIDSRNADLALEPVGMWLTVEDAP